MLEAVGSSTSKDLAKPKAEVPEGKSRGLLRLCVPLAADQQKRGANGGFEDANENSRDQQGLVVVRGCTACSRNTPESDVESEPFSSGDLLEEPYCDLSESGT